MPRYGPGQTVAPSKPKRQPQAPAPSPEDLRPSQPRQTAPPPRRARQAPLAPSPEDVRQPKPTFDQPNAPPPSGPPIPVLQNLGYHGSIFDFNQRIEHVTQTYLDRFGTRPTP